MKNKTINLFEDELDKEQKDIDKLFDDDSQDNKKDLEKLLHDTTGLNDLESALNSDKATLDKSQNKLIFDSDEWTTLGKA